MFSPFRLTTQDEFIIPMSSSKLINAEGALNKEDAGEGHFLKRALSNTKSVSIRPRLHYEGG